MKIKTVVLILTLLLSCSLKYDSKFIGKWKEVGGEKQLEFQKKLNWIILNLNATETLQGRYELIEQDKMQLIFFSYSFPGVIGSIIPVRAKVILSDNKLTLKMSDIDDSKFKKIK